MPLFMYKCNKCEYAVEKFQHNADDVKIINCVNCEDSQLVKALGDIGARVWLKAKDHMEQKIIPEIKDIEKKLSSGKDSVFLDIAGE